MTPCILKQTNTISDCWFQAVYNCLEIGRKFTIDKGSYSGQTRLEFDYFWALIKNPGAEPILPIIPPGCGLPSPVDPDYVYGGPGYKRSYIEYVMTSAREKGESYTYGERLSKFPVTDTKIIWLDKHNFDIVNQMEVDGISFIHEHNQYYINQIEYIIKTYKKFGHRNNQMVLQVAMPDDILLTDPPCLRSIDTRVQDNKLHFVVYFRSWDLWGGFPANLAGIQALKEYMAGAIGVEDGCMIVESKGLHLYGYAEDLAKMRLMR